jgi:hypothetical protein
VHTFILIFTERNNEFLIFFPHGTRRLPLALAALR